VVVGTETETVVCPVVAVAVEAIATITIKSGGGMFENANAEEGTKENEWGEAMVVGVTAAPRPY